MVWSPENWEWSGWLPCRQDVFRDRYSADSFFHSGRNAAEERFWKKFVHCDGSYGAGGRQGRYVFSWPAVRGVELRKEETGGEEENMLDWIEDEEERDEKEKKEEEEKKEKEEEEKKKEEKEKEENDGKEEQDMELTKENFSKRRRTRSECARCSRSCSVSFSSLVCSLSSCLFFPAEANDITSDEGLPLKSPARLDLTNEENWTRVERGRFSTVMERTRAAGEIIRASSSARTVPVA